MKCPVCKQGHIHASRTRVTLAAPSGTSVEFEDVPAQICQSCGEEFIRECTMSEMMDTAGMTSNAEARLRVRRLVVRTRRVVLAE